MTANVDERTLAERDGTVCGLTVAERDRLRQELAALPASTPPRGVWRRIEERGRAEGLLRRRFRLERARGAIGAGIAAAVVLAVLRLPPAGDPGRGAGPFPTEPAYTGGTSAAIIDALMVRSQWLERNLRALPEGPRVMRAGTAATISDLEDRIALIDHTLNEPEAALGPAEAEALWRERVRLMGSLVQLRYAQAQRSSL